MTTPAPMTVQHLQERILKCLPAGQYAVAGLLNILDIEITTEVLSAAVECTRQPRLLINPDFVAAHASTPEKLMMLVMHELHHVLLGHTRQRLMDGAVDNFVFDCVINAQLCRMFPQAAYTSLFTEYYSESCFVGCFLRPPPQWHPATTDAFIWPHALKLPEEGGSTPPLPNLLAARAIYRGLYSEEGISSDEVRQMAHIVRQWADEAQLAFAVDLLGQHGAPDEREWLRRMSQSPFGRALADMARRWPAPPNPFRGQSFQGLLSETAGPIERHAHWRQQLAQFLRLIALVLDRHDGTLQPQSRAIPVESPVMNPRDRRALVIRQLGQPGLLSVQDLLAPVPTPPENGRVHVYLDVSGSMSSCLPAVYGAVIDCLDAIHPAIHLFSTQVVDITPAQLRQGIQTSTGGTSITCVVEHMQQHRVRRAVILTDGEVEQLNPQHAKFLRTSLIGVVYVPSSTPACVAQALEGTARHTLHLK